MSNRKLNALFAERVLGWTVHHYEKDDVWFWYPKNSKEYWHFPKGNQFTESLDAAWPGVEKIISDRKGDFTLSKPEFEHGKWSAMCAWLSGDLIEACDVSAPRAVVKLCCLAVGVTQAEIDGAERVAA